MIQTALKQTADSLPLTAMQLGMVYESAGAGHPWINLEQLVLKFETDFPSADAVQRAWSAVCDRYAVLRTLVKWRHAGGPSQQVLPNVDVCVDDHDWRKESPEAQQRSLAAYLEADRVQGIDTQDAPGWRLAVMRTGAAAGYVTVTVHHALLDGRSIARVLADMLHHLETDELPRRTGAADYFDVMSGLTTPVAANSEAEDYFSAYLRDYESIGALSLPEIPETGAVQPARKSSVSCHITQPLRHELDHAASRMGATLANLVQAAWGLVLARWQGSDEVAIGVVRSGRHAVDNSRDTVGCLINTLPLRIKLAPQTSIGDLLQGVRRDTLAIHPFEQVSPADLRRWAHVPGQQPLFSSLVMFERSGMQGLVRDRYDGRLTPEISLHEEGGLPLSLAVYADGPLSVLLEFDPALVPHSQAERLLSHFQTLVHAIASAAEDTKLSALEMILPEERKQLLDLATPAEPVAHAPFDVLNRFHQVVDRDPAALAVKMASDTAALTYGALDQRANGLAQELIEQGTMPGDVVAVALERSAEFIVAMLAVLKCGAAFVPVDPSYPATSRQHMIQDSSARAIIAWPDGDMKTEGVPVLSPDAAPSDQRPATDSTGDMGAYIIYTSGSTGKPKGVKVSRDNLAAHIHAISPTFGLTAGDQVLQFASLSFDVALEEVFPTLLSGAALVLRSLEMAQSPALFMDALQTHRISVANVPTAFWSVLTDYLRATGRKVPESLRLMVVGGELVKADVLRSWRKVAPHVRWMNGYGPTETTITCTLYEAPKDLPPDEVPIGRPTGHARAYILAADGSLAPHGAIGELAIGGAAVTQGYVGRPDQTAEVFGDDPYVPGGRMYRTGDRAQWRSDTQLSFLGRQDRQVKLRGFRIDLRQIERALEEALPGARIVTGVVDQQTASARLVSWVAGDIETNATAIEAKAATLLPAHMRPNVVCIANFPCTAGGKIDMAALPKPQLVAANSDETGFETKTERLLQEIMAKVLNRKTIGTEDSFFDLGGHSLMAVELLGRIETATSKQLGIMDLQDNPTPRKLARVLETGSSAPKHIIPIQPNGNRPPLLGIHILGAKQAYFEELSALLGPDQPVMGVSVGSLDENTPTGVEFTARRYCLDIMEYYPEGPINLMAVSLGSYMAFELARQLRAAGREVGILALFDAAGPSGREEYKGLRRLWAHVRRAHYLGWAYPAQIIRNRIHNLRNVVARLQIQRAESEGQTQAPMTVFEFIASNELAVQAYTPRPLDVPLTIFRAESHFFDTPNCKKNGLGWASVAAAGVHVIDVPGGHLTMLDQPNVPTLALHFAELLERQQRDQLAQQSRDIWQSDPSTAVNSG